MLWLLSLVFFFFSCREIQHIRDFEGSECEKYDHRRTWQPTQLGTRLHVVSPSYLLLSFDLFFAFIFSSSLCPSHPVVFFFMSLFCFRSVLSCTLYSQCFISLIETHLLWLSSCSFEFCNSVCALIWYSCCVQQDRRISFAQKFLSRDSAHLTEFLNMLHLQYQLYVRCYRTNKNLKYSVLDCRAIKLNDKTNKKVIWF